MNSNKCKKLKIEEELDATLKSEGVTRTITVVTIADGVFSDVMTIDKEVISQAFSYVMNQPDGKTAYSGESEDVKSVGNVEDYGLSEEDIVMFVKNYHGKQNEKGEGSV